MNELDNAWAQKLSDALERAKAAGRGDAAEYLILKTANDAIRAASVDWLIDSCLAIAAEANRNDARVATENESPHSFAVGNAKPCGVIVRFKQGVRCLTIEAGWTRTPADGFMRGGALALARVTHFGIGRANQDLALLKVDDCPNWFAVGADGSRSRFDARDLQRHFQIFLGVGAE